MSIDFKEYHGVVRPIFTIYSGKFLSSDSDAYDSVINIHC